jgi:hypothetical protein
MSDFDAVWANVMKGFDELDAKMKAMGVVPPCPACVSEIGRVDPDCPHCHGTGADIPKGQSEP